MNKDLRNLTITFNPKNQIKARIIEQAEDGDFYHGKNRSVIIKEDDLGKIELTFDKFPKDSRYSIFVANGDEYRIGNNENSAQALIDDRAVVFTKTPGIYYRRFKHEQYYYIALGVAGGMAAAFGYRWVRARRERERRGGRQSAGRRTSNQG